MGDTQGQTAAYWQFLLRRQEGLLSFSSDQAAAGREAFFRQAIIGRESEILGGRLDCQSLVDCKETPDQKKSNLEELMTRLEGARRLLFDRSTGKGRLTELQEQIHDCEVQLEALAKDSEGFSAWSEEVGQSEKVLADLKEEDRTLADRQRQVKLMAVQKDYETLIELQEELTETREREGLYGARITERGHEITVHQLTELAGLRKESHDLEEEARALETVIENQRAERLRAEQERIMTSRRLEEMTRTREELRTRIESPAKVEETAEEVTHPQSFPSPNQIQWLAIFLFLAIGLLVYLFHGTAGTVLLALAVLALLGKSLYTVYQRRTPGRPVYPGDSNGQQAAMFRMDIQKLSASITLQSVQLEKLTNHIQELDAREADLMRQASTVGRKYRQLERELLGSVRQYAGPSELSEVDDIIGTLRRQRDSSVYYNERVEELQQRIRELKYGRSDEEMKREYQQVCRELDGCPPLTEKDLLPDYAQELTRERTRTAEAIAELEQTLKDQKKQLDASREATLSQGELERKKESLSASLAESMTDYQRLNGAVAWLKDLLTLWKEIDLDAWKSESLDYLSRLTGHRPGIKARFLPGYPPGGERRQPRIPGRTGGPEGEGAVDPSLFSYASQTVRYMALRLGLAASLIKGGHPAFPLLLIEPDLPAGMTQRDYLTDALEAWALETGQQVVYFVNDEQLISIAQARRMNVYKLD